MSRLAVATNTDRTKVMLAIRDEDSTSYRSAIAFDVATARDLILKLMDAIDIVEEAVT